MKPLLLVIVLSLLCTCIFSQAKMIMTVKDQKCDILGYTMDPEASGNKQSISIFGPMQNTDAIFQYAYESANPINTIVILITDPASHNNTIITLTNTTVYGFKKYLSSYSNGIFNVSSSGNSNTELKCKFEKIEIRQGSTNQDDKNINTKNTKAAFQQAWEMKMDSTVTGIGGEIIMQLPKGLSYSTHMEFYEAGDAKKRVASWFGNNHAKLLPGLYNIVVDNKYTIANVPVEQGKETILHMGVLQWSGYGTVTLENADHQKFSYAPPFKIVLPEGTYYIVGKKQPNTIVIANGNLTAL